MVGSDLANVINESALLAARYSKTVTMDDLDEAIDRTLLETLVSLRQRPLATLQHAQVICLECGKAHRPLSSPHLALHGLTATAYKQK